MKILDMVYIKYVEDISFDSDILYPPHSGNHPVGIINSRSKEVGTISSIYSAQE